MRFNRDIRTVNVLLIHKDVERAFKELQTAWLVSQQIGGEFHEDFMESIAEPALHYLAAFCAVVSEAVTVDRMEDEDEED